MLSLLWKAIYTTMREGTCGRKDVFSLAVSPLNDNGGNLMQPGDLKTWVEIVEGVVTSIGILAAGIWSFYVFVLGRSFAPNVQIRFRMRHPVDTTDRAGVIVSITIKNVGKTRVKKEDCWVALVPIALALSKNSAPATLTRIDSPLEFDLSKAKVYSIFTDHTWLEPDEEATEDVLITLGKSPVFKVAGVFIGHRKKWASSAILDTRSAEPPES